MCANREQSSRAPVRQLVSSSKQHSTDKRRLLFGPPVKLKHLLQDQAMECDKKGQTNSSPTISIANNSKLHTQNEPKNYKMSFSPKYLAQNFSWRHLTIAASALLALCSLVAKCDKIVPIAANQQKLAATKAFELSHRDALLSSMADQVERQHLRASGQIRSLVQQRPSKFDSGKLGLFGDESRVIKRLIGGESGSGSASQKAASQAPPSNGYPEAYLNLYQAHEVRQPTRAGEEKTRVAQDMSQIMMMHELGAPKGGKRTTKQVENQEIAKKDRKSPMKWLSDTKQDGKPKATLANVVSLLEPPLSEKHSMPLLFGLIKAPNQRQPMRQQEVGPNEKTKSSRASTASGTFSPRTNSLAEALQKQLIGPILGLGQMLALAKQANSIEQSAAPATIQEPVNQKESMIKSGSLLSSLRTQLASLAGAKSTASSNETEANKVSDLMEAESEPVVKTSASSGANQHRPSLATLGSWIPKGTNHFAQSYLQDSLRDLLTLSQLPILSASPVSTAPSELEPGGKQWLAQRAAAQQAKGNRTQALDQLLRYAYIFGSGVRRKRDPLKVLSKRPSSNSLVATSSLLPRPGAPFFFNKRQSSSTPTKAIGDNKDQAIRQYSSALASLGSLLVKNRNAKPRGVMWDMATDPTLAVTVFHLLERASVALPLGFLLMPFVQMVRTNPLHHLPIDLARFLPPRASHRSVDYEELAKRLDMMDKILSRTLRQTHREATFLG